MSNAISLGWPRSQQTSWRRGRTSKGSAVYPEVEAQVWSSSRDLIGALIPTHRAREQNSVRLLSLKRQRDSLSISSRI